MYTLDFQLALKISGYVSIHNTKEITPAGYLRHPGHDITKLVITYITLHLTKKGILIISSVCSTM